MAETVNFTGAVDRELLKRAKIIAAKSDTSIKPQDSRLILGNSLNNLVFFRRR